MFLTYMATPMSALFNREAWNDEVLFQSFEGSMLGGSRTGWKGPGEKHLLSNLPPKKEQCLI